MGQLFDSVNSYAHDSDAMAAFAKASGIKSSSKGSEAFGLAVPIVIHAMVKSASSKSGTELLMGAAGALSWVERSEPKALLSEVDHRVGVDVFRQIFDQSGSEIALRFADRVGLTEVVARHALEVVGLVSLASVTTVSREEFTADFLPRCGPGRRRWSSQGCERLGLRRHRKRACRIENVPCCRSNWRCGRRSRK